MDFTELFTKTLNETVAAMVAAEVAKVQQPAVVLQEPWMGRINELTIELATANKLLGDMVARYEYIEGLLSKAQERITELEEVDVDRIVEKAVEDYDFSTIVRDNINLDDIFAEREFADAVKEVIIDSMR